MGTRARGLVEALTYPAHLAPVDIDVILSYGITILLRKGRPMRTSKLTAKHQTTVPEPIREFLGLEPGDHVMWEIENDQVILKKASVLDLEFTRALEQTLSEWSSRNDEEAYRDL